MHRGPYTRAMHALPSHLRLSATFAALLTLVACGKSEDTTADGSSTGAATDAGSSTGTPTTGTTDDATTTTGEPVTTSGVTDGMSGSTTEAPTTEPATTEPATTTTTDPGTSTGPGTTTGNPDLCLPEPNDDACTVCTKGMCCDELTACQSDEDCSCMYDCIVQGGDIATCAGTCMVNPQNSPALLAIAQCGMANCNDACQ